MICDRYWHCFWSTSILCERWSLIGQCHLCTFRMKGHLDTTLNWLMLEWCYFWLDYHNMGKMFSELAVNKIYKFQSWSHKWGLSTALSKSTVIRLTWNLPQNWNCTISGIPNIITVSGIFCYLHSASLVLVHMKDPLLLASAPRLV